MLTAVAEPSIQAANEMIKHPGINLLVATGGSGSCQSCIVFRKKSNWRRGGQSAGYC